MKESFDDNMTKRIKEVMDQYEPGYAPHEWENFRTMLPVKEFWVKKLFLKYRYWFTGTVILGIVVYVSHVLTMNTSPGDLTILPTLSENEKYFEIESPEEIRAGEKLVIYDKNKLRAGINNSEARANEPGPASVQTEVSENSSLLEHTDYKCYEESGNSPEAFPELADQTTFISKLPEGTFNLKKCNNTGLVKLEYPANTLNLSKDNRNITTSSLKLQWPEFNILSPGEKSYNKFIGPNNIAVFYSPEIHRDKTLGTTGISQGLGFTFSGPVRPVISISAGLSYQANNFSKTVFSEKVLPPGLEQPIDSVDLSLLIDSTGISSGSYGFLELPLSVSFRLMENDRSGFWISTGISSIAFLKQDYTFETTVGDVSNKVTTSVKAWKDIYLFGSLNAGLFYRYKFTSRLSLHSSVMYKQHLGSMGYNSMKLNRLNLQIGLIYRFGRAY